MILCNRNDPLSHSVFASQGYGLFPCAHLCCVSDRALLHFLFLKPGDTMHLLQSPQGHCHREGFGHTKHFSPTVWTLLPFSLCTSKALCH